MSRVAYLVNQCPKVSHTFIRRELQALERQGFGERGFVIAGAGPRTVRALRRLLTDGLMHDALRPQAHG